VKTLREWHRRGAGSLILRLTALGAASGVAAWFVALAAYRLSGFRWPATDALVQAILRGAIVGALVGLVLHAVWRRGGREHS
jgi:hypothetical protein